jgi:hypothetical protein
MGHVRLGELPRTRAWQEVVSLLAHGAGAAEIANAASRAAETGLRNATRDRGVVETVWLLMRLPRGARADGYPAALADDGLCLSEPPFLMELIVGFSDAIDARLANHIGRSDLGEMAQTAAAETLVRVVGGACDGLFETGPAEVRHALGQLDTVARFGSFAREFVARLTFKCLDYYLSRVMTNHTGEGGRFATLAQQAEFTDALETHCREAAVIVERFAGEWRSKEQWEAGDVTREAATRFIGGAVNKLIDELRKGASRGNH